MPRYTPRQRRANVLLNAYTDLIYLHYVRRKNRNTRDNHFRHQHDINSADLGANPDLFELANDLFRTTDATAGSESSNEDPATSDSDSEFDGFNSLSDESSFSDSFDSDTSESDSPGSDLESESDIPELQPIDVSDDFNELVQDILDDENTGASLVN